MERFITIEFLNGFSFFGQKSVAIGLVDALLQAGCTGLKISQNLSYESDYNIVYYSGTIVDSLPIVSDSAAQTQVSVLLAAITIKQQWR